MRIQILASQNLNDMMNFVELVNKGGTVNLLTKNRKYYIEVV